MNPGRLTAVLRSLSKGETGLWQVSWNFPPLAVVSTLFCGIYWPLPATRCPSRRDRWGATRGAPP